MLGTGLQFGAVRGDDRFYIPAKARKNQKQNQNQNQEKQAQRKGKSESTDSEPSSNLERFLDSTTPSVPAQYFSKV